MTWAGLQAVSRAVTKVLSGETSLADLGAPLSSADARRGRATVDAVVPAAAPILAAIIKGSGLKA